MANTTSGTATFDKSFAIDEIIEEAFERIGLQNVAGYQLKSARRTLNILFQEWGNRGIHYWEIDELNLDLIEGQSDYDFFRSSDDGTSAVLVTVLPLSPPVVPPFMLITSLDDAGANVLLVSSATFTTVA